MINSLKRKKEKGRKYQLQTRLVGGIYLDRTVLGASQGTNSVEKVLKINVGTFAKKQLTCHVTGCQLRVKILQNVGMEPLVTRQLNNANVTRDLREMASNALIKKLETLLPTQMAMLISQLRLQASSLCSPMAAQNSQLVSRTMTNHPTNQPTLLVFYHLCLCRITLGQK